MPGYGIDDDELQKLFAEAGNAVKKASRPDAPPEPAPAPPPPPPAPRAEEPVTAPAPRPAAPPTPTGPTRPPVQLLGGEQAADAFVGQTAGGPVRVPWGQMQKLSLGRVGERQLLAFFHGNAPFYFSDDSVAYKGLLKQMGATTPMNWRSLVNEMAAQVADKNDPGLQALTGGGGMVPRYPDLAALINAMAARS